MIRCCGPDLGMQILEYRRPRILHLQRSSWAWLPVVGISLLILIVSFDIASERLARDVRPAVIEARVVDAATGQPVPGATVEIIHQDYPGSRFLVSSSTTDRQGVITARLN